MARSSPTEDAAEDDSGRSAGRPRHTLSRRARVHHHARLLDDERGGESFEEGALQGGLDGGRVRDERSGALGPAGETRESRPGRRGLDSRRGRGRVFEGSGSLGGLEGIEGGAEGDEGVGGVGEGAGGDGGARGVAARLGGDEGVQARRDGEASGRLGVRVAERGGGGGDRDVLGARRRVGGGGPTRARVGVGVVRGGEARGDVRQRGDRRRLARVERARVGGARAKDSVRGDQDVATRARRVCLETLDRVLQRVEVILGALGDLRGGTGVSDLDARRLLGRISNERGGGGSRGRASRGRTTVASMSRRACATRRSRGAVDVIAPVARGAHCPGADVAG